MLACQKTLRNVKVLDKTLYSRRHFLLPKKKKKSHLLLKGFVGYDNVSFFSERAILYETLAYCDRNKRSTKAQDVETVVTAKISETFVALVQSFL